MWKDVIEVNKLISALQDNVQSCVVDPQLVVKWSLLLLKDNPCFIKLTPGNSNFWDGVTNSQTIFVTSKQSILMLSACCSLKTGSDSAESCARDFRTMKLYCSRFPSFVNQNQHYIKAVSQYSSTSLGPSAFVPTEDMNL